MDIDHNPIAVKCEVGGLAGPYIRDHVHVGDRVEAAAPCGGFGLRGGNQAVVLLSAGIGVTPVLAMLRALSSAHATRTVYWIHCARNGGEHAFARDAQQCLRQLQNARLMVVYSQPLVTDALGAEYDRQARLAAHQLLELGIPENADVYLCGPATFMADMRDALAAIPIPPAHIRSELYGTQASMMPGVVLQLFAHSPHVLASATGTGPCVSVCTERCHASLGRPLRQSPRTCRGVRCPNALGVPYGRLPHLHQPDAGRVRGLQHRTARPARCGQRADLLLEAERRCGRRHLRRWPVSAVLKRVNVELTDAGCRLDASGNAGWARGLLQ